MSQAKARKAESIDDESLDRLMNALAELYVVDGRFDKALSVYLDQVHFVRVFLTCDWHVYFPYCHSWCHPQQRHSGRHIALVTHPTSSRSSVSTIYST